MQSLDDIGSVVIRKEVKEVGVYNKKDRRTEGQRLILAFSSGELINRNNNKKTGNSIIPITNI